MRLVLALALLALGCGGQGPSAEAAASPRPTRNTPTEKQRCRRAPTALADALGQALERRVQAAESSEEAALSLLELTPERPGMQTLLAQALAANQLTKEEFGRCLELDPDAYGAFERRLAEHLAGARARARGLPQLSASDEGCQRLLPLTVSAKENHDFPIALAATMVLPCAGRVTERELRCAIAEESLAHFQACQRGERDPPPSSH